MVTPEIILILFAAVFMLAFPAAMIGFVGYALMKRKAMNRTVISTFQVLAPQLGLVPDATGYKMSGNWNGFQVELGIGWRWQRTYNSATHSGRTKVQLTYCFASLPAVLGLGLNLTRHESTILDVGKSELEKHYAIVCDDPNRFNAMLFSGVANGRFATLAEDLVYTGREYDIVEATDAGVNLGKWAEILDPGALVQLLNETTYLASRLNVVKGTIQ